MPMTDFPGPFGLALIGWAIGVVTIMLFLLGGPLWMRLGLARLFRKRFSHCPQCGKHHFWDFEYDACAMKWTWEVEDALRYGGEDAGRARALRIPPGLPRPRCPCNTCVVSERKLRAGVVGLDLRDVKIWRQP